MRISNDLCANIKMIVENMFKVVQRELSWGHRRFITTVIARSLRDNGSEVAATRLNSRDSCIRRFSTQLREMVKARKYVVVNYFVNEAKPTDLKLVEEELPPLQNGGRNNDIIASSPSYELCRRWARNYKWTCNCECDFPIALSVLFSANICSVKKR